MAKKSSIREEIEALKEAVGEIKDATVDKEGKPSMPAGSLQRGVEGLAGRAGIADTGAAWNLAKDVGRAFTPAQAEALARAKLRGENYEDAKAKAEESRENLENNRPGLSAAGTMFQGAVGLAATIALYAKLAGGGNAAPAAPAAAAPAAAVPKGNLKAMGKLGLVAAIGAAAGSYLMSQNSQAAPQSTSGPAPAPQPAAAPVVAAAAAVKAKQAAPAQAVKPAAAKPAERAAKPAQRQQKAQPQRSSQQRRQAAAQQKQRAGSYERTYRTGKKAGITETVFLNGV